MTGDEMAAVLKAIGWTAGELARRLGVRPDTVQSWLAGRREIPPNLGRWLLQVRDVHDTAPPLPDGWRGGGC
jgi:transcriptional regulator with XRE-family HTH domain